MARRKKKRKSLLPILILMAIITIFTFFREEVMDFYDEYVGDFIKDLFPSGEDTIPEKDVEGILEVHFIDVGQGDSVLVIEGENVMLIDTGDTSSESKDAISDYLEKESITEIDYLILTHPDSDHIGGAPMVIESFNVVNCIMPDVVKDTKIYENTLIALDEQDVNVIAAESGAQYALGDADFKVLAPNSESYSDWNDYSVVIKLVYGARSIMFTGDAHVESEEEILAVYSDAELDCDVLKVGHHGSDTSSGEDFLSAVSPLYAVISCGEGNKYGHPHGVTLEKLEDFGVTVYRTDLSGTIVLTTDGTELNFAFEK